MSDKAIWMMFARAANLRALCWNTLEKDKSKHWRYNWDARTLKEECDRNGLDISYCGTRLQNWLFEEGV